MYAEVILSKATPKIDRVYHYAIPEELREKIVIGSQVVVPFGKRKEIGYIIGFAEKAEVEKVKEVFELAAENPLFTEKKVALAKWVSEYYLSFFISALRLVLPPGIKGREKRALSGRMTERRRDTRAGQEGKTRGPGKAREGQGGQERVGEGLERQKMRVGFSLTAEQQEAFDRVLRTIKEDRVEKFLLYGVTGSGKTEIYLQLIAELLKDGKTAIVLVPEISLTPQVVQRFKERFVDHLAVLHSGLTMKQRNIEWERILSGEAKIVLGTRSALFAPLKNLGLIVIDEEYETTYKQEKNPRYHAREVAFKLAEMSRAVVIMGTATPSIETYYHAEKGGCTKLVLSKRIDARPLPPAEIVDMRGEKDYLLSGKLRAELKETLGRGEQAILFINRRGYFTFVICKTCGHVIECPKCSVALTYHSSVRKLRCSRCNFSTDAPIICPHCQNSSLKYFGMGTQRIENEVADVYPAARILRYDSDTVGRRGSHDIFFAAFAEGKADVLIGTQMVTKGMDIANVTLVGVVSADTILQLPDFRSAEHTFQLLTQVAGRAGRHHLPGKVIIQTYNPDHYAVQFAAKHDYEGFYKQEIEHRRELDYPPFSRLISLLIMSYDEKKLVQTAGDVGNYTRKISKEQVLGPAPAPIYKMRGEFRYRILLKGKEMDDLRQAVEETLQKVLIPPEVRVAVDVDPMEMM